MKTVIALTITLIFLPMESSATQLPGEIRQQLDRQYFDWKFLVIEKEIHTFLKEHHSPQSRPDIISGDFDGNGQMDYAVYIVHGKRRTRKTSVIAFLRTKPSWKKYLLESTSVGDESIPSINYLALAKKGTRDYDYSKDKKITYLHDSIFVGYFAKAGVTYVYGKGRFRQIVTSD